MPDVQKYFVDQARATLEPVVTDLANRMREHDELQHRISEYKVRDNLLGAEQDRHEATKKELTEAGRVLRGLLDRIKSVDPKVVLIRCPDCSGRLAVDDHVPGCPLLVLLAKTAPPAKQAP